MLITTNVDTGHGIIPTIAAAIDLCRMVNVLPYPGMPELLGGGMFTNVAATPDESEQCTVRFKLNDVTVSVRADSDPELIFRDCDRALRGYIAKTVGPYPKPELSDEELANDARIEARWAAERERYVAKRRIEARMANAPDMEFSDENAWLEVVAKNRGNFFGDSFLAYAERWSRMMQLELSEGKMLEEVWRRTSLEADLDGISGAIQSAAADLLTLCWVYGAELRRLHNAYWGSSATDGTVNPSIIRFDNQ